MCMCAIAEKIANFISRHVGILFAIGTSEEFPRPSCAEFLARNPEMEVVAALPTFVSRYHWRDFDMNFFSCLIDAGADVNARDKWGDTCLHLLCKEQDDFWFSRERTGVFDLVQFLLARGADVSATDRHGRTPLHYVAGTFEKYDSIGDICGGPEEPTVCTAPQKLPHHVRLIKLLVQHQANVNARDSFGHTPLLSAVQTYCGRSIPEVFVALLDLHADINAEDTSGSTPLLEAFHQRFSLLEEDPFLNDLIVLLLGRGAKTCVADRWGCTPLHIAAEYQSPFAVRLLIDHQAEVNAKDVFGKTPLHKVPYCRLHNDGLRCIRQLLEHGADMNQKDDRGTTALELAVYNVEAVQLFIDYGADVYGTGHNVLQNAVAKGSVDVVRLLLQHQLDENVRDNDDNTLLHLTATGTSCADINPKMLKFLLDRQADVNARNKLGDTPLHCVFAYNRYKERGGVECVRLLVERGADPFASNKEGDIPLLKAMRTRKWKSVRIMLDDCKSTVNLENMRDNDNTLLHLVITPYDIDFQLVTFFLNFQTDVNATNTLGDTPLHNLWSSKPASRRDDIEVVRLLIGRGANLLARNKNGDTPLHRAMRYFRRDLVQSMMLDSVTGFNDLNLQDHLGNNFLHLAARNSFKVELVEFFVDRKVDVNARNEQGDTPLHVCTGWDMNSKTEIIRLLTNHGANPFAWNKRGDTPIHRAMRSDKRELVRILLDNSKTTVDEINGAGDTLLSMAIDKDDITMVVFLVERGADMNIPNCHGTPSLLVACEKGNLDIIYGLIRLSAHHVRRQFWHKNSIQRRA